MTWIQTHHARAFDLLAPRAEDVDVADIAHALARINRFNGHTAGEPYSVAHHSMLVADLLASWGAPPAIVREGLLHDAGEAYYGDVTAPTKLALRHASRAVIDRHPPVRVVVDELPGDDDDALRFPLDTLHERIDRVVRAALVLPEHEHPLVKRADLVALAIERRALFGSCERDWHLGEFAPTSAACGRIAGRFTSTLAPSNRVRIDATDLCTWNAARDRFLALLSELDAQIVSAS